MMSNAATLLRRSRMRHRDLKPRVFAAKKMDHIAAWLDRRTPVEAWGIVLVSSIVVAALDFSIHTTDLCTDTLYIVPVSLAAWMFRSRAVIGFTALAAFAAFLKYPLLHTDPNTLTSIYSGISRAFAFVLLMAITLTFRRSYDYARFAASRDRMTGALNKQAFHERVSKILEATEASGRVVLLLYLDLDGFKAVNDRFGHDAGDELLQDFARGLRGCCETRIVSAASAETSLALL
ncbi:GGDEF domain-containing protein [Mesorhizobium sp. M1B.F.Ca.ET.045.04.1.1]|nr:GGDEF domain-containing protein [Mesorhizobium sp. M1B.F.Ca.ET.045.04.1.1]